ncbi:recombinase family protein [Salmonella enterica subsp. enterica serovar Saintpaul]|nr:recombinase family protein [Salmonella enterica subsp. enterica serovar Saintpaul]
MSRVFAYCRVSTTEQTTANQAQAIAAAGFDIKKGRLVEEEISGSVQAMKRPKFRELVGKLEEGDRLVVLKLDRLGRDNIDVQQTIDKLLADGIQVTCLDLPVPDLGSSAGKLMRQLMGAFAEFERNRIIERTREGLARAKQEGKRLGRPVAVDRAKSIQECKAMSMSQTETVKMLGCSLRTVKRYWNTEAA